LADNLPLGISVREPEQVQLERCSGFPSHAYGTVADRTGAAWDFTFAM